MPAQPHILPRAFGLVHIWWMQHPWLSAVIVFCWFLVVVVYSLVLGIGFTFSTRDNESITGFLQTQWFPIFLLGMPLSAFLMSWYFRAMERALLSLDAIIKPVAKAPSFSEMLGERLRYSWPVWIFPLSIGVPLILTTVADVRDILAPLQSPLIPIHEVDWSSRGFKHAHAFHPLWYLGFNVAAFSMQVFVTYCGFLSLFLTTYLLSFSIGYGIGGKEIYDLFSFDGPRVKFNYKVKWDYEGTKGRCGLDQLDRVYFLYVAMNFLHLGIAIASVLANRYLKDGVDLGSAILVIGSVFFLPVAFLWVFLPYYTSFPSDLPPDLKDSGFPKPSPWPLGNEKVSWGALGAAGSAWAYLAWQLKEFF